MDRRGDWDGVIVENVLLERDWDGDIVEHVLLEMDWDGVIVGQERGLGWGYSWTGEGIGMGL